MNYKNVKIAEGARIAKQSVILGDVTIGRDSGWCKDWKRLHHRSRKPCDKKYGDPGWFTGNGKPGQDQTKPYLGRKTRNRGE